MSHARTLPRPRLHVRRYRSSIRRHGPLATDDGFDWEASGWAGLAAGVAFILIESTFVSLFNGGGNADAIRQIAALALGQSVLPPSTLLTAIVFLAAMGVHMILSLIYARILAAGIHGLDTPDSITAGACFGVMLYGLNYYVFTGLFPWFAVARGWITLSAHVAFGAIAAGVYAELTAPARTAARGPSRR